MFTRQDTGRAFAEGRGDNYSLGERKENELHVDVTAVLVGTDHAGRRVSKGEYGWEGRVKQGGPETGDYKARWNDEPGGTAALVPDTPENRAALNALFAQLEALHGHLKRLMAPDALAATLAKVAGGLPMLPAPKEGRAGRA